MNTLGIRATTVHGGSGAATMEITTTLTMSITSIVLTMNICT